MKRSGILWLLVPVACGVVIAACGGGSEATEPTQPYLSVGIDKTPTDTLMRIEVFNVPLRPDGRLAPEYFVSIEIASGTYFSVQPVTIFRFGHLCSRPWAITLRKTDPDGSRSSRLDRKEGTGC